MTSIDKFGADTQFLFSADLTMSNFSLVMLREICVNNRCFSTLSLALNF